MRITDVEPIILRVPHVDPSRADSSQDAFLVRIHTDEGLFGIGEADTAPFVAREIVRMPASHAIARGLSELLVGQDALNVAELWRRMVAGTAYLGGSGVVLHTLSAVDMALWDLRAKAMGRPVWQLLGGQAGEVQAYASAIMPASIGELRTLVDQLSEAGFSAVKVGWGPLGTSVRRDAEMLRAARDGLGATGTLMVDAGLAYTLKEARQLLEEVRDCDLYWLEEPLAAADPALYRRLAQSTPVRIAAGERAGAVREFVDLVADCHIDVLQPDISRSGGFTAARQIAELMDRFGVEIVPHCFATGVSVAAALQCVAALPRRTFIEWPVTTSPLLTDILREPLQPLDGVFTVPTAPGLGVGIDEEALERYRVH